MRIAVIGTGYVGLVTGTCLAESGNDVICVDIDEKKIERLKQGMIPIYEPGLEELVIRNVQEERLEFTTDLAAAVHKSLLIFIAVGTPLSPERKADLRAVYAVAREIGQVMEGFKIIVMKSTVPVGTHARVQQVIAEELRARHADYEFDVVSNPEFLKEGAAIEDFMKPDRVIIGVDNIRTAEIMRELYAPFVRTGKPILIMNNASAEMTKYAANALLAAKISFMNEIANICERVGADVDLVRQGIGSDSRIGYPFIFPGVGYGGSCFPKDIQALIQTARDHGYEPAILPAVEAVNQQQKKILIPKILQHFGAPLQGKTIAVWGLAFKPKTDDMREAPSIIIIESLLENQADVTAYDPVAVDQARMIFDSRVKFAKKNYDCLKDADALVVVTEWDEFRRPNWDTIKSLMRQPVIFDGRNIYDPKRMKALGFTYYAVGR
ncbi:MAG TPA: UDP-glucose/GDP-mannose dehydrogenase family protein [bacterium]|nr:UDP-glucose/GDP-mannose dehydrogenase family protein [Candidatus Omnitrophota bacterium]HOL93965.1 UDP-glucose/GDP-mannose dehydrogenase family protein [bacterium]